MSGLGKGRGEERNGRKIMATLAPSAAKASVHQHPMNATLKRCATQRRPFFLAVILVGLLSCLPAVAQVQYGDLHADSDGEITVGYTGSNGNYQQSTHSYSVGGNGTIRGYYYNPNFISFTAQPYYDRSQNNSDAQSITNSSGYVGTVNIFNGSRFPGIVSFNQQWDGTGTFGLPDVGGLITNTKGHGFSVGWSALLPGLPSLSVGFSDGASSSSVYGSDAKTEGSNRTFTLGSSYKVAGFSLNGGYTHVNTTGDTTGLLQDGEALTTDTSSNLFRVTAVRSLPFYGSQLSIGASHGNYHSEFNGDRQEGTTNAVNTVLGMRFGKVPLNLFANYTDNAYGMFIQQSAGSGQQPPETLLSPTTHLLVTGASTVFSPYPRVTVGGYVYHTQEYDDQGSFGRTQVGGNVSYGFVRRLQGLTFTVGMVDMADQRGNSRAGLVGNVDYRRNLAGWETDTYFRYDQNMDTLYGMYVTSAMSYGFSVKRNLPHGLRWAVIGSGGHSGFEQGSGNSSHGEALSTMIFWHKMSLSGNYMRSDGSSLLTGSGLIGEPLPGQDIPAQNLIFFNGKSYGGTFRMNPFRGLMYTFAYSKSQSNTLSPLLTSNNSSMQIYTLLSYRLRKLLFSAGATNFHQSLTSSGLPPSMVTSYYFGVSRWFKGF